MSHPLSLRISKVMVFRKWFMISSYFFQSYNIILDINFFPFDSLLFFCFFFVLFTYMNVYSLKDAIQQLVTQGGYKELWRGLLARSMSLAGTFTVVPIVMEAMKP